jgi:NTE family protein
MIEAFNIMQPDPHAARRRSAGRAHHPHIGHIGWLDFHRAEEAIAAGKAATETALEPIEATIAALA